MISPLRVLASLVLLLLAASEAAAAGARSFKTGPIQISADGANVWVVNHDNDSVTHVDALTEPAPGSVTEHPLPGAGPHSPRALAVSEDGREVWVACHDSDRILVLAGNGGLAAEGSLIARIDLPFGSGPAGVALSRDQRRALVTCLRSGRLVLIDAATHAITDDLPTYRTPHGACFTEDGVTAWITHERVLDRLTRLGRLDLSGPIPRVVTLHRQDGSNPQDSAALRDADTTRNVAEGGYLHFRGQLAQRPGGRVWVPTQYSNVHDTRTTPDSIFQSTIRMADMTAHSLPNTLADKVILTAAQVHDITTGAWIGPGWDAHVAGPVDLAFSADGSWAYVVHELSDDVVAFRTDLTPANTTGAPPLREIAVGRRPQGIAVSPVSSRAYVADMLSRAVSVVDLTPGAETELRRLPTTPTTGETRPAWFLNGERLFHGSDDPRISVKAKAACASCHLEGEDDGRTWDLQFLPGAHGPRSTQSLLGLSLSFGPLDPATGLGQLHRSGDRDEVQDFEHTFVSPQMGGTGFIAPAARQPALGAGPNAGLDADLDDLAAYVLALPPIARSPFRAPDGSLTEGGIRGATFFKGMGGGQADAGCVSCHVPDTGFSDQGFHDVGAYRHPAERDLNNRAPQWAVNTPTIVGAWNSPPFAGSSTVKDPETILDLLVDYGLPGRTAPHGTLSGLTGRQVQDLASFLEQADGRLTASDVTNSVDDVSPRIVSVKPLSATRILVRFSESVAASAAAPSAWNLTGPGGPSVPVLSGSLDAPDQDRVTLTVAPMQHGCSGAPHSLRPVGPIFDRADSVTGGVANALATGDPSNTKSFVLGDTITLTFGASGEQDVTIPVHDAGANAFLDNVSNGSVYLTSAQGLPNNCSFVRFEWSDAFRTITGVTSETDILDASFSIEGAWGDSQPVEARRVLQAWWDHGQGDQTFNPPANPVSGHFGPTRQWSELNVKAWNARMASARVAGVEGRSLSDYLGAQDAAFTPDVVAAMTAIVGRTDFGGPGITDAYRFWFTNPSVDFGHVLQLRAGSLNEAKFRGSEEEWRLHGPVLSVTYSLSPTVTSRPREVSATALAPLLVARDPAGLRLSFEDLGAEATAYSVYEGLVPALAGVAPWYSHASTNPGSACGLSPAAAAGRRAAVVTSTPGRNEYFLVTAVLDCAEGPSGADSNGVEQDPSLLDCLP